MLTFMELTIVIPRIVREDSRGGIGHIKLNCSISDRANLLDLTEARTSNI